MRQFTTKAEVQQYIRNQPVVEEVVLDTYYGSTTGMTMQRAWRRNADGFWYVSDFRYLDDGHPVS